MKSFKLPFRIQLFTAILAIPFLSYTQMIINSGPEVTPIDMVECILGEGVLYSNVTYQGADIARGIFSNGDSTDLGLSKGIFLTSGAGYIIPGPNNSGSAGVNNGLGGHPTLNNITTGTTYDASVLEFDVLLEFDTLKLKYVFGSEDYNEWVSNLFTDVFGLFITGPNPMGGYYNDKNIAIVPGTANTNVSINNVNNGYSPVGVVPTGPCTNCEYFWDNTGGLSLQYDGFTVVMTAWLLVVPCEEYHFKLGVADVGDHIYDSGIFIEENVINCAKIEITSQLNPPGVTSDMLEGFVNADIIFELPGVEFAPVTLNIEIAGTADPSAYPPGDFEEEIPTTITFEEGEDSVVLNIAPVYDGIIEGEESILFIVENWLGCILRYDSAEFYIQDYLELDLTTSPNTMICEGDELDLWVQVNNGFPPYTYLWEPGSFTQDTITVSPEENTTYVVTITDLFEETAQDSVQVIVFPVCDLETFYFDANLNPELLYDVFGNVMGDTVFIVFPPGTNLNGLIPSFTFSNVECSDTAGTITDFTDPIVYQFIGPGGCISEWIVIADIETGNVESKSDEISIFPNPVKDIISISNAQGSKLTVLNSLGVVVLEIFIDEVQLNLYISDLVEGIYYLQFISNNDWFVEKIIISR